MLVRLTPRDVKILQDIYHLKTMTIGQINRIYFKNSASYGYKRLKKLERNGCVASYPLVNSKGKKLSTCYYVTYKTIKKLNLGGDYDPTWIKEPWKQQYRVAVSEIYVQSSEACWQFKNSRRAKKEYNLNRGNRLAGILYNGIDYGVYLFSSNPDSETVKAVSTEIERQSSFGLNHYIVLHQKEEWIDIFDDTYGAREIHVMPFDIGLTIIRLFSHLNSLLQQVLGEHPVKQSSRFFASYLTERQGGEYYISELISNNLVRKYFLKQYTLDRARLERRRLVLVHSEGQKFNLKAYPHIKAIPVPVSFLTKASNEQLPVYNIQYTSN